MSEKMGFVVLNLDVGSNRNCAPGRWILDYGARPVARGPQSNVEDIESPLPP